MNAKLPPVLAFQRVPVFLNHGLVEKFFGDTLDFGLRLFLAYALEGNLENLP